MVGTIKHVGCKEYWSCSNEPGQTLPVLGSIACLSVSTAGSFFLFIGRSGDSDVATNTARFFTSFSALLIFTKSQRFNQMLHTFVGVIGNASALFSALVAISCLYALVGQDLFGDKVRVSECLVQTSLFSMQISDEVSQPFFGSYGRALVTVFRMFVDGTLGIMYEASDTTSEAARIYFISFSVLFSLLFAQLLLGIVVNMFDMVKQLNSSQAYSCLNRFFTNANADVSLQYFGHCC